MFKPYWNALVRSGEQKPVKCNLMLFLNSISPNMEWIIINSIAIWIKQHASGFSEHNGTENSLMTVLNGSDYPDIRGWRHKVVTILLYHDYIGVSEQLCNKSDNINKVVTNC
jgi:hypothetical protein